MKGLGKETYADYWNTYVSQRFPKIKERYDGAEFPGDEWGNESSWQAIVDHLLTPAGIKDWSYAIEIGGGGGKYTEQALTLNDKVKLWTFDVSRDFLTSLGQRLGEHVGKRLFLNEIDGEHPDQIYLTFEEAGLIRQVDAMFSVDAMVHVDLQYLVAYWINAALVLKPGGRIAMTVADATSPQGFQKLLRDIAKFYVRQGRICAKFEYLSRDIVTHVLGELGFEIEYLEQWSPHTRQPSGRDLFLIAKLVKTDMDSKLRAALLPLDREQLVQQRRRRERPEV